MTYGERMAKATALRMRADAVETCAVSDALVEAGGFVTRAAGLLGISGNLLASMLRNRPHLKSVAERAEALRAKSGYVFGRPITKGATP